jgi:hypothetical protein
MSSQRSAIDTSRFRRSEHSNNSGFISWRYDFVINTSRRRATTSKSLSRLADEKYVVLSVLLPGLYLGLHFSDRARRVHYILLVLLRR